MEGLKTLIDTIKKGTGLALSAAMLATLVATTVVTTGCPQPNGPTNPIDVYDASGFHKETGLHRDTNKPWNTSGYDRNGNYYYDENGYDYQGYNSEGYNVNGFNRQGLDREGYDVNGYKNGFDKNGIHSVTGKPYDTQGNDKDGNYYYDPDGYDYQGYNAQGWNREHTYKITGELWDETGHKEDGTYYRDAQGYDYQGYNEAGWHKDPNVVNNKFTNQPYDLEGKDRNGLTYYPTVTPVGPAYILPSNYLEVQSGVNLAMSGGKTNLENNVVAVRDQFNGSTQGILNCPNAMLKGTVAKAIGSGTIVAINSMGDDIVERGLYIISEYIVCITKQLPVEKQAGFALLMDAFRIQAYLDHRGHGDETAQQGELNLIYSQLNAMGINVNQTNLGQYLTQTVIPSISGTLDVNPALIQSLLNQITGFEQFYANVDDARALDLEPVLPGFSGIYNPRIPVRNLIYTRSIIDVMEEAHEQEHGQ